MSFKSNKYQQLSLTDSFSNLTPREQKVLENSWAKPFAEEIFPAIDEERFSVLYSSKASRPNAPVNVIVGALILKELFDLSDSEIVENLMLDLRYQYALHTTSFSEQPLSESTLSRFRRRCYEYESTTGIDLYHDCVQDLSGKLIDFSKVSGQIRDLDPEKLDENIRMQSRAELIYSCIAKLVKYLSSHDEHLLPEEMKHYLDSSDFGRKFYYGRSSAAPKTLEQLFADADLLIHLCGSDYDDVTEYELLVRCLSEQTQLVNGKRKLRL